jgi:hypothetical protein
VAVGDVQYDEVALLIRMGNVILRFGNVQRPVGARPRKVKKLPSDIGGSL